MNITVKGKQMDVGESLRTYVSQNLSSMINKYFENSMEANVVFSKDRHLFKADIQVHIGRGILLQSSADATEPYPAYDLAAEKLAKRLRRYKSRLRDHHRQQASVISSPYFVLQPEPEDKIEEEIKDNNPVIVAEMTTSIETMTVSEAVMRMDLADLPALLFRNKSHGNLNMVYRRNDGNIGWVDSQIDK